MLTVDSASNPHLSPAAPQTERVSVILPTLNEAENIILLIEDLLAAIPGLHEILVVDDHSPDGTAQLVHSYGEKHPHAPVRVLERTVSPGLTNSLADGIAATTGDIVVWMDCDFSMPPSVIPRLLASLSQGYDVAVGSRFVRGGSFKQNTEGTPDSPLAVLLSRIMNYSIQLLLDHSFKDYTSGFIAIRRQVLIDVPLRGNYGEYFIDLMFRALRLGYKTIEIPYVCLPRQRGVSKTGQTLRQYLKLGWGYLLTALRLRWEALGKSNVSRSASAAVPVGSAASVRIAPMQQIHVPLAAGLHHQIFYMTLQSRLGIPFLEDVYGALLLDPSSSCWVMLAGEDRVVGIMAASRSMGATYRHSQRNILWRDKLIAILHIATSWRDLKDYLEILRLKLRASFRKDPYGVILSLGIHPAWQGKGLGRQFLAEADAFFAQQRMTVYHVDVHAGNERSIAFCRKNAFIEQTRIGNRLIFERSIPASHPA